MSAVVGSPFVQSHVIGPGCEWAEAWNNCLFHASVRVNIIAVHLSTTTTKER